MEGSGQDVELSANLSMPLGVYYIGLGLHGMALGPGLEKKYTCFDF